MFRFEHYRIKNFKSEKNSVDSRDKTSLFVYRAERGVEDALQTLVNNLYEHLECANNLVKVVYIDFSNNFNTIQPHLLMNKLMDLSVNSKIIL